jgi:serine/threonine-protein kinase
VLDEKWAILEFIAKGGMGEVYRAHQLNLKRDVAIKVISQEWIESLDGDTEEIDNALERFLAEVQTMAQIRHANVLQIYDFGSTTIPKGGRDVTVEYIVMEYIPGKTLRHTMSEEGFDSDEDAIKHWISNYFFPVLDGVQALHKLGIIHRDLKPDNVLLDGEIPKIADFGLARSSRMTPITRSVDVKGSPGYMSPEHFFDLRKTDQQADVYSLGKILFEAIVGKIDSNQLPFNQVNLPDPSTPFMREIDRILRAATAEEKKDRLKSVTELYFALSNAKNISVVSTPPPETVKPMAVRVQGRQSAPWLWACLLVAFVAVVSIAATNYTPATGVNHVPRGVSNSPPTSGSTVPHRGSSGLISKQRPVARPNTVAPGSNWAQDCDTEPGYRRW